MKDIFHSPDIFILSYFSHAYVGQDYSIQKNVGKISLEQIDSVSCSDHDHWKVRFKVEICFGMDCVEK